MAKSKKILVLYNPISGQGRSAAAARDLTLALTDRGWIVETSETAKELNTAQQRAQYADYFAICVCGGDGTVARLLPSLSDIDTAVYIYPTGNENLLARFCGMTAAAHEVERRLLRHKKLDFNFATLNDRPFATMVSIGLDSSVVREISQTRSSAIGMRGYIVPTIKALLSYRAEPLSVSVDGKFWVENRPGFLIIANTPMYAGDIGLVPEASPFQPQLAVRFFPATSKWLYIRMLIAFLCKGKVSLNGSEFTKGFKISISTVSSSSIPVQGDGDYYGDLPAIVAAGSGKITLLG